ncbi:MAG TPA: hypothetical protein VFP68_19930 [Burkholderiaceae bacterium]|nr:hypothetical protein [Burkholderiaceae bacterium]
MKPKQQSSESNPDLQGEGNYTAGRHYNEATKQFVDSGKVDKAAASAKPESPKQERDMKRAEQEGKSHAKGEDPQITQPGGGRGTREKKTGKS